MAPTARETKDSQDEGKSTYLDEIWMHALFLISAWGFLEEVHILEKINADTVFNMI